MPDRIWYQILTFISRTYCKLALLASNSILNSILHLLFPPICLGCGTPGKFICEECRDRLLVDNLPECHVCRRLSASFVTHQDCLQESPIRQVVICWQYNHLSKRLMALFKYKYRYRVLEELLGHAAQKFSYSLLPNSIVTNVPSSMASLKDRGFCQTEIIAKILAKQLSLNYIDTLLKPNSDRHQAGQSRIERQQMLTGTYILKPAAAGLVRNRHIVIIDDVCTTGTTLRHCAAALQPARPASISAFALFRGKKRSVATAPTAPTARSPASRLTTSSTRA